MSQTRDVGSWPAAATRFVALRLRPGADLRGALEEAFAQAPESAGFVAAAVGSLTRAPLRLANRNDETLVEGPLEIVALSGTLSLDGPHLHLAVSGADGAMRGGHLLRGALVRTTAELVIGLAAGVAFERPVDAETGYRELAIRARDP